MSHHVEGPGAAGPPAGHARVYFVLAQGFPSGRAFVVENERLLGFVGNRQYFFIDAPAGEHLFMLISEQTEGVRGSFEAGKTYHMKLFITPGFMSSRVYWSALEATGEDAAMRKKGIDACRRVELNPTKAASWERKYAEKNRTRVANFEAGKDEAKSIGPQHGL